MTDAKLVEAYQALIEGCRQRGEVLEEPGGEERRRDPRVRVRPNRLAKPLTPWKLAVDISANGMAFYADEPADAGHTVRIALGEDIAAEAEVVACQEIPLATMHDPPRYRIRCRFNDEAEGLRLLMAVKEMEAKAEEN